MRYALALCSLTLACSTSPVISSSPRDAGQVSTTDAGAVQIDGGVLPGASAELEALLRPHFAHIYRIGGLYIVGTDEAPLETNQDAATGGEVVTQAVKLFSSLLDANEDGVIDDQEQLESLGENLIFAVGYQRTLEPLEESLDRQTGRYVMSMKTDIWPYMPDWTGRGFSLAALTTSMWRPEGMNALWEEVFHTYTEAMARRFGDWTFSPNSPLGRAMQEDISNGAYDIEEQNRLENGDYDFATAVNEYLHQIWVVQYAGLESVLTDAQKRVLAQMTNQPGFPMTMNANYPGSLAARIN